jgi:hypothetical protein
MGIHSFPAKMLGKVPTFYIDDVFQEDAGGGNVRVLNYCRRNGVLVPEFEVIIASRRLLMVGRKVSDFARSVFNNDQLRMPGEHVH